MPRDRKSSTQAPGKRRCPSSSKGSFSSSLPAPAILDKRHGTHRAPQRFSLPIKIKAPIAAALSKRDPLSPAVRGWRGEKLPRVIPNLLPPALPARQSRSVPGEGQPGTGLSRTKSIRPTAAYGTRGAPSPGQGVSPAPSPSSSKAQDDARSQSRAAPCPAGIKKPRCVFPPAPTALL